MSRGSVDMVDMYTEVTRLKQVFRHIQGIPIPFPIPITLSSLMGGVVWILAMLHVPGGDPFMKFLFTPMILVSVLSYLEPDQVSPWGWMYAYIRKWVRPRKRVINRSVPPIGYQIEYRQYSIVRKNRKGGMSF